MKVHPADHLGTTTASLLQPEQVMEEVEVGEDSKICLTEMDEDRNVQNGIGMEVAQTNHPELQQIPQEWMNRKSQPTPEIILEYHHSSV